MPTCRPSSRTTRRSRRSPRWPTRVRRIAPRRAATRNPRRRRSSRMPSPSSAVRKDTAVGRFYTIDGADLPSVTHILSCISKPALINWAANQERALVMDASADLYADVAGTPKMSRAAYLETLRARLGKEKAHRKALEKAAEIGSQAHALIEWNLRQSLGQVVGPEPRVVDAAQWAFMAFDDWAKTVRLTPVYIEQTVFSRQHGYAGTMDLLALVNSVPTLVDFKTAKAIYPEAHLQNVAYQVALEEMGHTKAEAGCVVRLPKLDSDPAFEVAETPPVADLLPTFLAILEVWKWWHQGEVAYAERRKAAKESAA